MADNPTDPTASGRVSPPAGMSSAPSPRGGLPVRATAVLVLADGSVVRGAGLGARGQACGEVCFNTSLTGYQEILTDPSYAGQLVAMTCTQIGNVGTNPEDEQSARPQLHGFVVKECFEVPSSWRSNEPLPAYLERWGVPGIAGIDTRALVRRIRDAGFQNAVLSTDPELQDEEALVERAGQVDLVLIDAPCSNGQQVWHRSQPNSHCPIAGRSSRGIAPRCSIVR